MIRYSDTVINQFDTVASGNSSAGATVTVRDSVSKAKVVIYSDLAGAIEIDNPVTANELGNYNFVVDNGVYDLVVNEGLPSTYTIFDKSIKDLNSEMVKVSVPIAEGQTDLVMPRSFSSAVLFIDGVAQSETSNAYTVDLENETIILSEPLAGDEVVEAWLSEFTTDANSGVIRQGDRGNPFIFDTCFNFVAALPYSAVFSDGDWIQVNGRTLETDGGYAMYQVTNVPPTKRYNFENYIPLNSAPLTSTLWAVLREGFQRDFYAQPTELIAHRGFNDAGVQNVLSNYGNAVRYSCDGMETDWQVSSDGFAVMYHDVGDLSEDTNGTGTVKENTLATLQGLTFNELAGSFWADKIKITLVDEFFDFAVRHNQRVYIEIKDYRTTEDIKMLTDLVESYNYEGMTIIASFKIDELVEVRRLNKRVGVGWLTTNIFSPQEDIDFDKLQKLKYADALIVDLIMVEFPEVQQKCYDAGIGVGAWGIQYTVDTQDICGVNVPRIVTDLSNNPTFKRGLQNVTY